MTDPVNTDDMAEAPVDDHASTTSGVDDRLFPDEAWQELTEYDDRTSPAEYPDMALITFEELASFMARARPNECTCGDVVGENPDCVVHGALAGEVSALEAERDRLQAKIAEVDQARACYAKALDQMRSAVSVVRDGLDDEGDRVYLGSTNHTDTLDAAWEAADKLRWEEVLAHTQPETDLASANLYLQEQLAAERDKVAGLVGALEEIHNLEGEINPSNYDHDDACFLNKQFVYAITIAGTELAKRKEAGE